MLTRCITKFSTTYTTKPSTTYATKLLHYSNTITSTVTATTITIPLIVYSRGIEQYISDRKIPVHAF